MFFIENYTENNSIILIIEKCGGAAGILPTIQVIITHF